MMMNRDRIGFWVRLLSIVLAFFFVGAFIFVGLGTNVSYNLFDLIGGDDQQAGEQTTDPQDQIQEAEKLPVRPVRRRGPGAARRTRGRSHRP